MAVNFKVPKSPKRDIFVIDEFKGVDLTNTGANIDDTRSPNAENMVRYVPGKVRKRTGYHTKVKFSEITDVNRAANTSEGYVPVDVTGTSYATRNVLCYYYDEVLNGLYYIEVKGKGSYTVGQEYIDGGGSANSFVLNDDEMYAWSWNNTSNRTADRLYIYRTSNDPEDNIQIRKIRVCASTSATTAAEWKALPWTPAPEDNDVIYVEDSNNPAIFGCHMLKSGTFVGNRVRNVNRVTNSSDTFTTFTVTDSSWLFVADLYDFVYTNNGSQTTRLYMEFDYESDGEVDVAITGWYSTWNRLQDTSGTTVHYTRQERSGSYVNRRIELKAVSGTATVKIKNLIVCYEKDENLTYRPAPEDGGGIFHIEDIYNVGSKNYAIKDNYYPATVTSTSLFAHVGCDIADATSKVEGFCKVAFDLYTTSTQEIDYIKVETANDQGGLSTIKKYYHSDLNSEHIEFYLSAGTPPRYTKTIWVDVVFKSVDGDSTIRFSNIELKKISGRSSYDISDKYYIYHAGKKLYLRASNSVNIAPIYNDANEHISKSWQLNEKIFILDGKNIYSYAVGDETVDVLSAGKGYIPLVTISKSPSGGGTSYESLNMLQPGFYEQFVVTSGDSSATAFHLSFNGLDDTKTKAWILDANGNWVEKTEGTHYSVNRAAGIINFNSPPGTSLVPGQDNVKILAYRTIAGYADRVAKCTIGTLFGVGGAADRLFLSGNPDYPNWDFYSDQYNPTYFPDTGYSTLGSSASAIVGYAIVNNYLATFKDDFDNSQAVFIREGNLVVKATTAQTTAGKTVTTETSEPAFPLINTLQGNGVVAPYSFGYLQTEPLFLTRSGIYAITAQDITGEKYSQNRSFYLDGKLTKENGLENAVATVFKDQYILALNNKLYILDGLQATRTDRSEPYATRQYVAFYCTNVPAVSIWTDDQALWIGTHDGRVCEFGKDIDDLESYNDDGEPIYACWETPDLDGKLFYKNKTFRYFAIRMMKALRTSVKVFAQKRGNWSEEPIKEDRQTGLAFDFNNIDFEHFSFSTDRSERVVHTKVRIKKVDKARFRVENGYVNEPFGIFDLALEYIESGNYKG